jgi:GDPmannose 4,6-dehydratase
MLNQPEPKEYILSSNETHTVKEFVEAAFSEVGIEGSWQGEGVNEKYISSENGVLVEVNEKYYRPAEVDLLYGDSTPAREEIGWSPKISFTDLVSRMVKKDVELSQ